MAGAPRFSAAALAAHLLSLLLLWHPMRVFAASRPHIVFFLADDYGFADCSYHTEMYGNDTNVIHTPNIDQLAASGIKLENYYVQPVCSPTRATLMTGRYVIHHGVRAPFVDSSPSVLPIEEVTIAEKLKEAGYSTYMVGKWHLGFRSWKYTPQERGFDEFYGYYAGSQDYYNHQSLCWPGDFENGCFENTTRDHEAVTGVDLHSNRQVVWNNTEYSTTLYTTIAENIIQEHASSKADKPMFLYLPYQAVHVGNTPTKMHPEYWLDQAPERYIKPYSFVEDEQRRNLSAMVAAMDEAVGNVTSALKSAGLWDDTLFIFSTDNGGPLGDKASNYPLRGGKGSLWEGGVRGIGFITAGDPGQVGLPKTKFIYNGLMHVSDWLPTLCTVAGCQLNGTLPLDSVDMWDAVRHNSSSPRDVIVHDICFKEYGGSCLDHPRAAIRSGDFKLLIDQNQGQTNLFNIRDDPEEKHDLSKSNPDKVKQLMQLVVKYNATTVPANDRLPPDLRSNPILHGGAWLPWLSDDEDTAFSPGDD